MGWTGFVLEMKDGRPFAFGTRFGWEFFDVPDGYAFSDVWKVHNHSYLAGGGEILPLRRGMGEWPEGYDLSTVLRERPHFVCYYDV